MSGLGMMGMGNADFDWSRFLGALQRVESGGVKNPDEAVGDAGKSRGAYQLGILYVKDAQGFDKSLKDFSYDEIVSNRELGGRAVRAYLTRYGSQFIEKNQVEPLSRQHNGGSKGHMKKSTEKYAKKFMKIWNDL